MTTDQAAAAAQQATGQSVNGAAPADDGAELLEPDTGERWLGILVIAAGCFLLIVGLDRASGGRVLGRFNGGQ